MKIDCSIDLLSCSGTREEVSNEIAQGLFTIDWIEESLQANRVS